MRQTAIDDELASTAAEGWLYCSPRVPAQLTRRLAEPRLEINRWSLPPVEPVPTRGER
jgi:hypothetical protein